MLRRSGGRIATGVAALALGAAGCAAPSLLPERAATSSVTAKALLQAQQSYLYPDELDQRVMIGALDALEANFDAVRFDAEEDARYGILTVGAASARVPLRDELELSEFEQVLGRALAFAEEHLGEEANRDEESDLEMIGLRGALAALDRYSTIFSGRGTEDFQIRFSGKLRGIGARIGRRDGQLVAVRVFRDSPAERAGLKDGDEILSIDGNPTTPLTLEEAVGQIRGREGTSVLLGVLREEQELEIEIVRGEVRVPSIEARLLEDGVGYAHVQSVSRTTAREFKEKLRELGPLTGLVLDLRGNSGGSMKAASDLADFFLEHGRIVRVVDREGGEVDRAGTFAKPDILFAAQVVILVDAATASAAEILSGALAPLPRVTIVGQTTFGKGLIQRVIPLERETLLKLTVAEYLLSDDRVIHEKGIEPDIVLFPVSTQSIGRLAELPDGALPYLRRRGEDDTFPLELASELLRHTRPRALERMRARVNDEIQSELETYGIRWRESLAGEFEPLEIRAEAPPLRGGETTRVGIDVRNPNPFPIPNAWAALIGPAPYFRNQLIALGTIPAGRRARGHAELTPQDGLAVDPLPARVLLASGARALQEERVRLAAQPRPPVLAFEVERVARDRVQVTVFNLGCCDPGQLSIAVRGAVRSFDTLEPGESETVELPITGKAEEVQVALFGAGVQRRIDVPLPEGKITVVPPAVELQLGSWLGQARLEVHARSDDGLREGWLMLDGQKEAYVAWNGSASGEIRTGFAVERDEERSVMTKVETVSGVAVIDIRTLTAD